VQSEIFPTASAGLAPAERQGGGDTLTMVLRAATPSKCVTGSSINRQRAGPRVSGTVGVPTAVSRVPRNAPGRRAEFIHKLTSAGCDAGCVAGCVAGQAQRFHKSILPCFSVKPVVFLLCHLWDFAETTSDGRNPSPRTPASGPASSARWRQGHGSRPCRSAPCSPTSSPPSTRSEPVREIVVCISRGRAFPNARTVAMLHGS